MAIRANHSADTHGQGVVGALARREAALWYAVLFAAVGDVVTTGVGLHFGLVEGNPVVSAWIDGYGLWLLALVKGFIVGLGWLVTRPLDHPGRVVVPLGLALPWLLATMSNATLIALVVV